MEFRIRVGIVSDEFTDEYCKAAHGIEPENCTTGSPATNKPNNVITENCTTDCPATNKPNNVITENCTTDSPATNKPNNVITKNDRKS